MEFKIACLVHQSLASLAPTYLTTDIHLVSDYSRRPLRSSTDRTLTVPRTHNRFGDRSFAVAGPRLWNSLPIRCSRSLATDSLGDIEKIIYLEFQKSQRSVMHDSLCYINILTYLFTYLLNLHCKSFITCCFYRFKQISSWFVKSFSHAVILFTTDCIWLSMYVYYMLLTNTEYWMKQLHLMNMADIWF